MGGEGKKIYCGGCDVGSTTGKAVIMDDTGIVATSLVASGFDPEETAREALEKALAGMEDRIAISGLAYLIGTGYGRNEVPFADENISEISCHASGVNYCDPEIRTIVDIGGQDVKAISVKADGSVLEFAMNDKCAAGTGRFFEAMSRIFKMDLEEFSLLSLKAKKAIPVTSQCSVFAETEVISLISRRHPAAEIAAGIQAAVGKRCFSLIKRVGVRPKVTVTGGCAKNGGLLKELNRILGEEIAPLPVDPQLMGALGAAVTACRKAGSRGGEKGGRESRYAHPQSGR